MNRHKWIISIAVFALIGATAGLLHRLQHHQKLGSPGVKTSVTADPLRSQVDLPERVLDYTSESVEVEQIVLDMLPKDTSFGQRRYRATDGFGVAVNVVLMGSDRTSLHRPQFCLRGSGWVIQKEEPTVVPMTQPAEYDLPVTKLTLAPEKPETSPDQRGIYVYWFVTDGAISRSHGERMWWMFKDLVKTGVLQRWAYITYFAPCAVGQEEATFARMKDMIAASVPKFQLTPQPAGKQMTTFPDRLKAELQTRS